MASTRSPKLVAGPAIVPDADDREGQLISIARRLFARHGYEGTSLRDIAEEAKITKAALYYHFPNKEALYEKIVLQSLEILNEVVASAVSREAEPRNKVRAFMLASADFLESDRDAWMAGANTFWTAVDGEPRAVAVHLRDRYERLLRKCVADGVRAGQFRKVDPAMAGRLLISTLAHLCRWHSPSGPMTARQVVEKFLDIALRGMDMGSEK